jgi:hypothetical protein
MRRRFSYANVAATLALVLSMSGGALAASHYLITSTKQIKPSVLKALKGKAGPKGAAGLQGPPGLQGVQGVPGNPGAPGAPGKEGKEGKEGVSGTVSMTQLFPEGETNTSGELQFLGKPALETFVDKNTAAQVTGQVDLASNNSAFIEVELAVCYQPQAGGAIKATAEIFPEFKEEAFNFYAQSVSGIVGNLTPGNYLVGICTGFESANTLNGAATGSVILAQTRSGASIAVRRAARSHQRALH